MSKRLAIGIPLLLMLISAGAQNNQQANSTQSSVRDEPRLVHADVPMYPLKARIAHIIGTVELEVTVKEGQVVGTTVKSGQPLLAKVSTENIKSWRFESDVNEIFTTKFIYEIEDVRTGRAHSTNPTIEMQLPAFVKITARSIMVEDPMTTRNLQRNLHEASRDSRSRTAAQIW